MDSDPRFHLCHTGHGISGIEWRRAKKKTREGMWAESVLAKALRWEYINLLCVRDETNNSEGHCGTVESD